MKIKKIKHIIKPDIVYNLHIENDHNYIVNGVVVENCHRYVAKTINELMDKGVNAKWRIGLTGTLDDSLTNELSLVGMFGPVHRVAETSELMDRGILTELKIQFLTLKYDEDTCQRMKHADYHAEIDFLVNCHPRNKLICRMANTLKGNTLVLVNLVEKHAKPLKAMMEELCPDKEVFLVYGGTDIEDREAVRKLAEQRKDIIILATYKVFSTGINIKNLPNLIFGSPSKAKIRILQSIGRILRLHADKLYCLCIDMADDLRHAKRKSMNYALEHAVDRIKIYQREGFEIREKTLTIKC